MNLVGWKLRQNSVQKAGGRSSSFENGSVLVLKFFESLAEAFLGGKLFLESADARVNRCLEYIHGNINII